MSRSVHTTWPKRKMIIRKVTELKEEITSKKKQVNNK